MRSLRIRVRDEDGAIAVMAAVLVTAVVLAGALSVDVGRVAYVSRDQQGATDRAALDSVQTLRAAGNEASMAALEAAYEGSVESLARNPRTGTQRDRVLYRVDLGRANDAAGNTFELVCGGYFDAQGDPATRDALMAAGVLEEEDVDDDSAAAQSAPPDCAGVAGVEVDAIRLWTHGAVDYVLTIGESSTTLHKISSARSTPLPPSTPPPTPCPEGDPDCDDEIDDEILGTGTISAGTSLASMEGGVLNQLLSEMVGGSVAADLASYHGIAEGRVRLGDLVDSGELTVGSVDELLHTEISVFDLIRATVTVLQADGDPVGAAIAAELDELTVHEPVSPLPPIRLGDDEDAPGGLRLASGDAAGMDVRVDAVDLVFASLQIANLDHALDLELSVFGETLPMTLKIIEPPVVAEGPPGTDAEGVWLTEAKSAQVRLGLAVDLDALISANSDLEEALEPVMQELSDVVGDLLGLVTCVLGSCPAEIELQTVDLVVRAAEGESGLADVECVADDGTLVEDGGLTTESIVRSARVAADGAMVVFTVDGEQLRVIDATELTVAESASETTHFEGPLPTGPIRIPEGGTPLNASLSAGVLEGTGDLSDVDGLVESVAELLGVSLVGVEGIVTDVLDQLGLGLTSIDVLGQEIDCTQRTLQPSVSGN